MLGILARLGHVLYWLGCIAAVVAFLVSGSITAFGSPHDLLTSAGLFLFGGAVWALPIWLVGLGSRYILSGGKKQHG